MAKHSAAIVLAALGLAACAGGSGGRPAQSTVARPAAPTPTIRPSQVATERGYGEIIGARAGNLTARFGEARIDLTEGPARKLQFAGERCVLDIFLYPLSEGAERVATHVETRLRNGGGSIASKQCIAELERR